MYSLSHAFMQTLQGDANAHEYKKKQDFLSVLDWLQEHEIKY
jgi:hypothetical protein